MMATLVQHGRAKAGVAGRRADDARIHRAPLLRHRWPDVLPRHRARRATAQAALRLFRSVRLHGPRRLRQGRRLRSLGRAGTTTISPLRRLEFHARPHAAQGRADAPDDRPGAADDRYLHGAGAARNDRRHDIRPMDRPLHRRNRALLCETRARSRDGNGRPEGRSLRSRRRPHALPGPCHRMCLVHPARSGGSRQRRRR